MSFKKSFIVFGFCSSMLFAYTIGDLFDALKKAPSTKIDSAGYKLAKMGEKKVRSNYYPKINLFATYTHYNSPTNLRPIDPIASANLMANNEAVPFSNTIQKIGFDISVPVYIKELEELTKKAAYIAKSAKLKRRVNFLENEAIIVVSNATLEYLDNLLIALKSTKNSLLKTRQIIQVSVNSGRMPGIALDKLDEKLNQLEININNIFIKRANLIANIEKLTSIELKKAISMKIASDPKEGKFFSLKPLRETINASMSDLKASKQKRYYPKVVLKILWSENYAPSDVRYSKSIHRGYGYYQLGVQLPLYDKNLDSDIQMKEIKLLKSKMKLKKSLMELKALAKALHKELDLLKISQKSKKMNIKKREDLLKYAKVAFKEGRMTEEDYLVYEDKVLDAKSSYYQTLSQKWQVIAKLAVIYGYDLKGVVK